jgi:MFS family permease
MKKNEYSKYRWFLLFVLLIVGTAQGMALIAPAPLVEAVAKSLGVSAGQATFLGMGSFTFCVAIGAIIGGPILDKFGVIKVWIVCALLLTIGLALTPVLGSSANGYLFTRILEGLASGPIMASAAVLGARYFPINERSIVQGVQGMTVALGVALGFIIVPTAFKASGNWQSAISQLAILCGVGLVLTLVAVFIVPKDAEVNIDSDNGANKEASALDLKKAFSLTATWSVIACVFLYSWLSQAFNDMTPGYIAMPAPTGLGLGPVTAGQLMVGAQLAGVVGALLGGIITEKIFKGKAKPVIIGSFILSGILIISLKASGVYSSQSMLMIVIALAGFFGNFINPQALGFISKHYPTNIVGKVGGASLGIGIFGGTAGVAVGSYFLHTTNSYMMSISVIFVVAIIGAVVALFMNKPKVFSTHIDSTNKPVEL